MDRDNVLIFTDHLARFYTERYSFAPVTGRVIGYLAVCQPMEQSINDIADALLTSRSAVNGAIQILENMKLIQRSRPAGSRADLISLNPLDWRDAGFDPSEYTQSAALAREGLQLLKDAPRERREPLEKMATLGDFLAERLPQLYDEWVVYDQKVRGTKKK